MNPLRHIRAILLLPVTVTVFVPAILINLTGGFRIGRALDLPWSLAPILTGVLLIGLGLALLIQTNVLFVRIGRGTLAPWDPTQKLVVRGIYRNVRNPMISGVLGILLGEALAFSSVALFCWFLIFLVLNLVYTPLIEERDLERRFGAEYREYKQHVPRWIPRLRRWEGPPGDGEESGNSQGSRVI